MNDVKETGTPDPGGICDCVGADLARVRRAVTPATDVDRLFSRWPVLVSTTDAAGMQEVIDAVHRIVALPAYQDAVTSVAPAIARVAQATRGVFLGFDFHVGLHGPKLIEINTNAGGALMAAAVRGAQLACCPEVDEYLRSAPDEDHITRGIVGMFREEWRLARGDAPLRRIAIVDEQPATQFLYPEFEMFATLFAAHGVEAVIADVGEFEVHDGRLTLRGAAVDLVYNRSTDFYLERPDHAALARAINEDLAVVTPHPRAHALFASKRNLALLTDEAFLAEAGARRSDIDVLLAHVPATRVVEGPGESWWSDRKRWFFKPMDGFGSRGSYRGDKLTKRVFAEVMRGRYVAQEFAAPGERWARVDGAATAFKVDVRNYVYDGRVQQRIARLYQGQTTNFRTPGGGFAPVYVSG